jgi:hypothetical protein
VGSPDTSCAAQESDPLRAHAPARAVADIPFQNRRTGILLNGVFRLFVEEFMATRTTHLPLCHPTGYGAGDF